MAALSRRTKRYGLCGGTGYRREDRHYDPPTRREPTLPSTAYAIHHQQLLRSPVNQSRIRARAAISCSSLGIANARSIRDAASILRHFARWDWILTSAVRFAQLQLALYTNSGGPTCARHGLSSRRSS